jgi:hypothetical protein
MTILKLSATALALGSAIAAQASPVLVSQTVNLGQVLNGGAKDFQFDLSAALAQAGVSGGNTLSGNLIVYGVSDASYGSTGMVSGGYQQFGYSNYIAYYSGGCYYSSWGGGYCWSYPVYGSTNQVGRDIDRIHRDTVADTMRVTAGGTQTSDTADQTSSSATGFSGWNYEGQTGGMNNTLYYNRQRDVYEAVYGDLSVNLGLDSLALADLQQDSILSFNVAATAGQFRVLSATLNVQVDTNSVPEPAGIALLATAAVTGAAFTRRRRKTS